MNIKTLLILVILVVAVGIGAAFLFLRETDEPGIAGDSAGLIIGKNAIYVAEQAPSQTISVEVVYLEQPGFVVIHENSNEKPGKILGVSGLLPTGETKDSLQISLSRSTVDGETIYAMLHHDDGDNIFDAAKDKPALDNLLNEPVMTIVVISQDVTEPGAVNP